jgi:hypothetical protein
MQQVEVEVGSEVGKWKATHECGEETRMHSWREGSSNGNETAAAADPSRRECEFDSFVDDIGKQPHWTNLWYELHISYVSPK